MNTPEQDKMNGTVDALVGKTKKVAGYALGNPELENKGRLQEAEGKSQKVVGDLKDKVQQVTHVVGDGIEKLGKMVQEKGHTKIGEAIHRAGDSIEHMADPKKI